MALWPQHFNLTQYLGETERETLDHIGKSFCGLIIAQASLGSLDYDLTFNRPLYR
jgi:hypothetical protein